MNPPIETPEARARMKARRERYDRTPKARAARRAREQLPESVLRRRAYHARPENRARARAYKAQRTPTAAEREGARRRSRARSERLLATVEGRLHNILKEAQRNSRARDREFTVTYEQVMSLYTQQQGLCALTGWPLTCTTRDPRLISIDRIDSDRGYTPDNIHLVAWCVNRAKLNTGLAEFVAMCQAVAEYNTVES